MSPDELDMAAMPCFMGWPVDAEGDSILVWHLIAMSLTKALTHSQKANQILVCSALKRSMQRQYTENSPASTYFTRTVWIRGYWNVMRVVRYVAKPSIT